MRYCFAFLIALVLAAIGQVASYGIIMTQWYIVAITMGFGANLVGFPYLNLIPISVVFLIGVFRQSWTLMLSLPLFIAIWAVPASLHRLSIADDFKFVENQVTSTDGSMFEAPSELILFNQGALTVHRVKEQMLRGDLERVVFATRDVSEGVEIPHPADKDFRISEYNLTEWRKFSPAECSLDDFQPLDFLNATSAKSCLREVEVSLPLPKKAFAQFRYATEEEGTRTIAFGSIDTGRIRNVAKFSTELSQTQITKRFRAYQIFPGFHFDALLPTRNDATSNLWANPLMPKGYLVASSPEVNMLTVFEELMPPLNVVEDENRVAKKFLSIPWYQLTTKQAKSQGKEFLDFIGPDRVFSEVEAKFEEIERTEFENPEDRSGHRRALRRYALVLCVNGYGSDHIADVAGELAPNLERITRFSRNPLAEECGRSLAPEFKRSFDLASERRTNEILKSRAIQDLRDAYNEATSHSEIREACADEEQRIGIQFASNRTLDGDATILLRACSSLTTFINSISVKLDDELYDQLVGSFRGEKYRRFRPEDLAIVRRLNSASEPTLIIDYGRSEIAEHTLTSEEREELLKAVEKLDLALELQNEIEKAKQEPPSSFKNYIPRDH